MKIPSSMRPKYPVLLVAGLDGLFTVVNLGFAQTWTPTSAPAQAWTCVASSADGTKLVAAGGDYWDVAGYGHLQASAIYISNDSGATWIPTSAPSTSWISVASSADGGKLVAAAGGHDEVGGAIYTSTNSGVTWTQTTAIATDWTNWTSVACSADGVKLVAAASHPYSYGVERFGGPIYCSTNSSATWTQTGAPSGYWTCVACSGDGSKLVAVEWFGSIYTSADSGTTWTQTSAPTTNWSSVASSADGTRLVAAAGAINVCCHQGARTGLIYTSTNSGATWTPTSAPTTSWHAVASSADGAKLVAVSSFENHDTEPLGLVYTSADSGATWTQANRAQAF